MAYTTQTTQQISDALIAQLESQFGQTIPILQKAFSRVLSKALAGSFALLWRYAGFMFLQLFVRYATDDEITIGTRRVRPLREWGRWLGIGEPMAATRAALVVAVTVNVQTGTLAAGTKLLRADTGVIYSVTYPVLLDAATVNATIRAVSDQDGGDGSGELGNAEAGDVISFMQPVPNVARDTEVVSTATQGVDAEDIETSYRPKVLEAYQNRPQGGALVDYRAWGKMVAGIVQIYPYKSELPGEMDIYVEATPESSGSPDGIPTSAQLNDVEAAINYDVDGLASRRPAGIEQLNVYPITRTGYYVEIAGLNPDTAEAQNGIVAALTEYFLTREPFILGLSSLPRTDKILAVDIGGIAASVAASHGATFTSVSLSDTPAGDAVDAFWMQAGAKAKLAICSFPS